ncbi:MscS Mechanosensitive ion channel [Solidesulfovibrio carbinoliphilus subsp. oakridgensis]|uniref:MscS Mechanosensitive ion channel n=1 Tax=Solidesulfovibrio carbinoliphilus subsp. oakridgensis TaxID=694327 RepID=G7Q689_9BACT|nr:mechanosensitive ion channel domain-containing protein [Solidesulfovibrio carbinoliphilus]EHJ47262.1 MscS Mechanosensitive ion channel [Solidesulfovibrio carbinoliphilus subsp. oakridgensis]
MPRSFARCAVPLVLFCLLAACGPGPASAQAENPALWRSIADGLREGIGIKRQELDRIERLLPGEKAALAEALSRVSGRLDQLLLLRGVAGETPWASRTLLMVLNDLSRAVSRACGPLADIEDAFARTKQEYATLRQIRARNASREYADLINEELAGPGHDFKALKHAVDALKEDVDAALAQATTLAADIEAARADEIRRFLDVFAAAYFASSGSLLRPVGLAQAVDDLREWLDAAPRFWGPIMAWTDWKTFAAVAVLDFAGIVAGLWAFAGRWPALGGEARPGLVWLAAGLALALARYAVLFGANQFTSLLWVLAVSRGLTLLLRRDRTLPILFGCFLAATALDAANLPGSATGLLWPAVAAPAIWRLRAAGLGRSAAVWVLAATAAAAILGFGPQAVMAGQALFMLHLTMGLSNAIQGGLVCVATRRERSLACLVGPLAVTVLATFYVAWVLMFMGGPGLMDHVFTMTVRVGQATVSLDALAGLFLSFFLLRLAQAWFQRALGLIHLRGRPLEPGLIHTVGAGFSYLTWVLFLLFALRLFEVPLGSLTWIVSGLSVGIGFGLKDIVNNFISGLIIMFGGAVKKGDIIQQGKNLGEVVDLSVRNTIMRTLDNTTVIIPNSSFLRGEIVNLSYQDATLRLTIPVTVAPGTKIKKVRKILLAVAREHADVLKKPPPEVMLRGIGRSGLEFDLYVWIKNFMKKFQVQSELAIAIDQQFQDNRILVAFQGVKMKYKPKGTEAMQLEAMREELRQKRAGVFGRMRRLRRVHARRRWPAPPPAPAPEE